MKTKAIVWVVLLCLLLCIFVEATDKTGIAYEDNLTRSSDLEAVSALENELLSDLETYYEMEYGAKPKQMPDHIDFSKSVRIYVDTDILSLNTDHQETILNALKCGNYVWNVYLCADDVLCCATISRGQPLNENESIHDKSGAWVISAFSVGQNTLPYPDQISRKLQREGIDTSIQKVVVVGGIPAFRYPIAIAFDGERAVQWLTFDDGDLVTSGLQERNADGIYDFQSLADDARESQSEQTGSTVRTIAIGAVCALPIFVLIGIVGAVPMKKQKSKEKNNKAAY